MPETAGRLAVLAADGLRGASRRRCRTATSPHEGHARRAPPRVREATAAGPGSDARFAGRDGQSWLHRSTARSAVVKGGGLAVTGRQAVSGRGERVDDHHRPNSKEMS
ncbi:hypothetical protein [Streptosporangium sp. NPDC000396]|uniref:hypothetical protein n=1 Tax=Streptosporangium sp. NPDC000396 TaxID=3366185 RepID=UPI0036C090F9